ncbi:MAG: hypothetical protein APF76_18175 [Desulfitibacter sp. BRH_c19]|nr:MAG: hypothetical protein APF76_18175 [Desulfitibacter sp. BRH_c19]
MLYTKLFKLIKIANVNLSDNACAVDFISCLKCECTSLQFIIVKTISVRGTIRKTVTFGQTIFLDIETVVKYYAVVKESYFNLLVTCK